MKNQYFGDVTDYQKYDILRQLCEVGEFRMAFCWMLTLDDQGNDGKKTSYLNFPAKWRRFSPELFDFLHARVIEEKVRSVGALESMPLFTGAVFHSSFLGSDIPSRIAYFEAFASSSHGCDAAFIDADNGLEVKSVGYGRKNSEKYVYWREIEQLYTTGKSLIIYQHFARQERGHFVARLREEAKKRLAINRVHCISTAHVVFLIVPQPRHQERVQSALHAIKGNWSEKVQLHIDAEDDNSHDALQNDQQKPDTIAFSP